MSWAAARPSPWSRRRSARWPCPTSAPRPAPRHRQAGSASRHSALNRSARASAASRSMSACLQRHSVSSARYSPARRAAAPRTARHAASPPGSCVGGDVGRLDRGRATGRPGTASSTTCRRGSPGPRWTGAAHLGGRQSRRFLNHHKRITHLMNLRERPILETAPHTAKAIPARI